jgi:hypothetical protein
MDLGMAQKVLMPNWPRTLALLGAQEPRDILHAAAEKAAILDPSEVMADLRPFIEDQRTLESFVSHVQEVLPAQLATLQQHLV